MLNTFSALTPDSAFIRLLKLRINRPDADQQHERERHAGRRPGRPAGDAGAGRRPLARLRAAHRSARAACRRSSARARRRAPSRSTAPIVNATTRTSSVTSDTPGRLAVSTAGTARSTQFAISSPSAPPARASSRLSTSSIWNSRWRDAPSATRTPISRCRATARLRNRLATFAQATSSTRPTAPSRISNGRRTCPEISSSIGVAAICSVIPAFRSCGRIVLRDARRQRRGVARGLFDRDAVAGGGRSRCGCRTCRAPGARTG